MHLSKKNNGRKRKGSRKKNRGGSVIRTITPPEEAATISPEEVILVGYMVSKVNVVENEKLHYGRYTPIYMESNITLISFMRTIDNDLLPYTTNSDVIIHIEALYKLPNVRNIYMLDMLMTFYSWAKGVRSGVGLVFKHNGHIVASSREFNYTSNPGGVYKLLLGDPRQGGATIQSAYKQQLLNLVTEFPDLFDGSNMLSPFREISDDQ